MAQLQFNGKNIHYERTGQGPAVVLLHGFLESSSIWDHFVVEFSKHFTVITIDLPGHGQSETLAPIQPMTMLAEAVKFVLDHEAIDRCTMTGHSMGGYVCLAFARKWAERLHGFCLFNSTAAEDNPTKKKDRERAVKVIQRQPAVFINEAIPNLFAPGNVARFATEIEVIKKEALQTSESGIVACLRGMKDREDACDFVRTTDLPVLFIVGKQDPVMRYEVIRTQFEEVQGVEAIVLENVGHMGFLEAQKTTLQSLLNFAHKVTRVE